MKSTVPLRGTDKCLKQSEMKQVNNNDKSRRCVASVSSNP